MLQMVILLLPVMAQEILSAVVMLKHPVRKIFMNVDHVFIHQQTEI